MYKRIKSNLSKYRDIVVYRPGLYFKATRYWCEYHNLLICHSIPKNCDKAFIYFLTKTQKL
jgi:hypothetical protein